MNSSSSGKTCGITMKGLIQASLYGLLMIMIVFASLAFLIWLFVSLSSFVDGFLDNSLKFEVVMIIKVLLIILLFTVMMLSIYFFGKTWLLLGYEKVFEINISKNSHFKKDFNLNNAESIVFNYHLRKPYKSFRQILRKEPGEEIREYLKEKIPDWEYVPSWKPVSSAKNFTNVLKVLDSVDKDEINNELPLFEESIRVIFKNLDNDKKIIRLLEPDRNMIKLGSDFLIINKNMVKDFFDGKHFSLEVRYKGVRGYSLKFLVK